VASVVCCRLTACCRGHAGRCYGAAGVRNLPRLPVGQAWACGLACRADWQGWNLPAAPDSMAQRADGQRPSAQLLEPLGPVRDAPLIALRMRACPCCVPPSSLPRARGADTMPAVANVFGVRADILLKNRVCAGAGGWMQVLDAEQEFCSSLAQRGRDMVAQDAGKLHRGCGIMQDEREDNRIEVWAPPL
jgi:hypothetical protein